MSTTSSIKQQGRLVILLLYLAALLVVSQLAFDTWVPPTTTRGLWFYAALAVLLLGSLLVTPFFTKPADAVANSVACLIALLAVNPSRVSTASDFEKFLWFLTLAYSIVVLVLAVSAIVFKDSMNGTGRKVARSGLMLADVAGAPRIIFSTVFLFALVTYHRTIPREYVTLSFAWILFIGLRPSLRRIWVGPVVHPHAARFSTSIREDFQVCNWNRVMGHTNPVVPSDSMRLETRDPE